MVEYNEGDYILTKDGTLFRIVNKYTHAAGIFYDLRSFTPTFRTYYGQDGHTIEYTEEFAFQKSVPRNKLRHLGIKIDEGKSKIARILYG